MKMRNVIPDFETRHSLANEERMSHGNLSASYSNSKDLKSDEMPKSQTFHEGFRKGMTKIVKD